MQILFIWLVFLTTGLAYASPPGHPPSLLLKNVTVIRSKHLGRQSDDIQSTDLFLDKGIIQKMTPNQAVPPQTRVIDYSGKYVIAGLIDGFSAVKNAAFAKTHLAAGVTTVWGASGGRRGTLEGNSWPRPRIHFIAPIAKYPASLQYHLNDLNGYGKKGVRIAHFHYDTTAKDLKPLVQAAKKLGMITIVEFVKPSYYDAVKSGADILIHTTRYSVEIAPVAMRQSLAQNPMDDSYQGAKWQYYRWLAKDSWKTAETSQWANYLGSSQVNLMPTASLLYLSQPWAKNPWRENLTSLLQPDDIHCSPDKKTGAIGLEPRLRRDHHSLARAVVQLEGRYFKSGARYLASSASNVWGTFPGLSLHHELEFFERLGMTPREALATATSNYHELLGWQDAGRVEENAPADLVVLDTDPRLSVIGLHRHIVATIVGGYHYRPSDLLK